MDKIFSVEAPERRLSGSEWVQAPPSPFIVPDELHLVLVGIIHMQASLKKFQRWLPRYALMSAECEASDFGH